MAERRRRERVARVRLAQRQRIDAGQPDAEGLAELDQALQFSMHDTRVEAPIEFFHSMLASFRGYDTLGETTVVFTAGAGVITLLRRRRRALKP